MRTLTAGLTAAQKKDVVTPGITVRAIDALWGVRRQRFTEQLLYTTPGTSDQAHGIGVFSSGGVVRTHRTSATVPRWQWFSSPGTGSAWTTWTNQAAASGVRAVCSANGIYGVIAWDDGTNIYVRTSSDSGATWSVAAVAIAVGFAITQLAVAQKSNGDRVLVWEITGVPGALWQSRQTAGAWGAATNVGVLATLTGVAVCHDGSDWWIVVTGTELTTLRPKVSSLRLGDGGGVTLGTWETAKTVAVSDDAVNVVYQAPSVAVSDTRWATWVERWTGTGAYNVTMTTYTPDVFTWYFRDPWAIWDVYLQGMALAANGAPSVGVTPKVYLSHPDRVMRSALPSLSGESIGANLLEASWSEPGACRLLIADPQSTVSALPLLGGMVELRPGYFTAGVGLEEITGPSYYVERVRVGTDDDYGTRVVEVWAIDALSYLDRQLAGRQYQISSGPASTAVTALMGYCGMSFSLVSSSAAFTGTWPLVLVRAGDSFGATVRRILQLFVDELRLDGAAIVGVDPTSGSSTYTFGGAGNHLVLRYRYGQLAATPTAIRVLSAPNAPAIDFLEAEQQNVSGMVTVSQPLAAGATQAAEAALAAVVRTRRATVDDELLCLPHLGAQHWDRVTVNDGGASLSRIVVEVRTEFRRRARRPFEQRLILGGL